MDKSKESFKDTFKLILKNFWFVPVLLTITICMNLFVFRLSLVVGSSMEPTLSNGDLIIAQITKNPERYDIIILEEDMGEHPYLIKRVIGLPGETIQISNNTIYINGKPIADPIKVEMENYGLANEPIVLDDNEYFVLGDNRNDSYDSREFGPVFKENILGKKLGS